MISQPEDKVVKLGAPPAGRGVVSGGKPVAGPYTTEHTSIASPSTGAASASATATFAS